MKINIRGIDQLAAWIGGLVLAGIIMGVAWWIGKREFNKAEENNIRVAKTAEAIFEKSQKSHQTSQSQDKPETIKIKADEPERASQADLYGYAGPVAPWRWMNLNPNWKTCGTGHAQSPVDISGSKEDAKLKPLKFHYQHDVTTLSFANNTVTGDIANGSWLEVDADRYDLRRMQVRTPSEHRINGLPYEMEVQLLHQELSGRVLILSIQMTPGGKASALDRVAQILPHHEGETNEIERFLWSDLLPSKKTYWQYNGSLTYPPCTEKVTWIVMTQPLKIPNSTIVAFEKLQKNNARPVQSLGKRGILRSNR